MSLDPEQVLKHAGYKADSGKNRIGLVICTMARAVLEVGKVGTFGAIKYADDNWLKVDDAERRYTDAQLRHLLSHQTGETVDPESGITHLAHAAWCALAVLDLHLRKQETNGTKEAA